LLGFEDYRRRPVDFRHPRLLATVRFTGEKRPSALTFYGKG
jgi:hypothetical protein